MKKNFCKFLALTVAALMMTSTMAFADAAIGGTAGEDSVVTLPGENVTDAYVVTATLTGLQASEEATILVLKDGVTLSNDIANSDIVYIDQLTTDENGSVTFTFDASAVVPAELTADVYVDFYCGYASMTADPLAGTALIAAAGEDIIYGDVNGDTEVTNADKIMVARHVVGGYEQTIDLAAADVNLDEDVTNADKIIIARYVVGGYYDSLPVTN